MQTAGYGSSRRVPEQFAHGRFKFIDGLRGLAATWVMLYHLFFGHPALAAAFPTLLLASFLRGYLGVVIFFVLSGFVMAFSQQGARVTPGYLLNFAARRSLRLDPSYWVMMAIYILVTWFLRKMGSGSFDGWLPTKGDVLINMVYLQDLTGKSEILAVSWTLCLEVQFYIVLILCRGLGQWLNHRLQNDNAGQLHGEQWILGFVSLLALCTFIWSDRFISATFLPFWPLFYLGALTWWTLSGELSLKWLIGYAALTAIIAMASKPPTKFLTCAVPTNVFTAIVTAGLIYWAGRQNRLYSWLRFRSIQFLGMISYSLYLVHSHIILWTFGFEKRLTHHSATTASTLAAGAIAIAVSIGIAWLMYRFVERPGVWLGKKLKHRFDSRGVRNSPAAAPVVGMLHAVTERS